MQKVITAKLPPFILFFIFLKKVNPKRIANVIDNNKWKNGTNSAGISLLKVNYGNTKTRCEIYSKLTIKTPNDTIDVGLWSLLLTLNIFYTLF